MFLAKQREKLSHAYHDANERSTVMNIGWIPGCTDYQSITIDNPMGVSGDNTRNYNDLIVGTYNFCRSPPRSSLYFLHL